MCEGLERSPALKKKIMSGCPASRSTCDPLILSVMFGSFDRVQPVMVAVGLSEPALSATSVVWTKPLAVANQRVPSAVRVDVGSDAPPHSLGRIPSPYQRQQSRAGPGDRRPPRAVLRGELPHATRG